MKLLHVHFTRMAMGFHFRSDASAELVFDSICKAMKDKHEDVWFADDAGDYQFKVSQIIGASLITVQEDFAVTRSQSTESVLRKLKSALGGGRIS